MNLTEIINWLFEHHVHGFGMSRSQSKIKYLREVKQDSWSLEKGVPLE